MEFIKINLQLFANTVQTTLLEGLSPEMKTFYDMTLIDEASANLVHDQFGQKRPIPANGGKTIEFRKFSSLPKATTALTEGVTPDGKSLTVTAITATVAQYGDYITQSDVLELTSLDNTILEATKLLGKQAGLTLDTIVRDKIHSENKSIFWANEKASRAALAAEDQLTVKEVQAVVAHLRAQNAPTIGGKYVAIIHPYVAYDLMRDPEWIDAHKYANPTNLYEGEIGEVAGVRFVQTTEAKIYEGGVFSTLVFGEGAYGVTEISGGGLQTIVKQKGSAGTADPLDQRSSVGWKAIKTAELLVPNYICAIESKSAKWSSKAAAN